MPLSGTQRCLDRRNSNQSPLQVEKDFENFVIDSVTHCNRPGEGIQAEIVTGRGIPGGATLHSMPGHVNSYTARGQSQGQRSHRAESGQSVNSNREEIYQHTISPEDVAVHQTYANQEWYKGYMTSLKRKGDGRR